MSSVSTELFDTRLKLPKKEEDTHSGILDILQSTVREAELEETDGFWVVNSCYNCVHLLSIKFLLAASDRDS
jgi:hypothetical protein